MTIRTISQADGELWDEVAAYAAGCSFGETGKYLSNRMKTGGFSGWERVFVALEGSIIAGFCALTKTSSVFDELYMPYIGFVFVAEEYHGHRISQKLCRQAVEYAEAVGFDRVYLYSDIMGLYEKYGFVKICEKKAPWGADLAIYMHSFVQR